MSINEVLQTQTCSYRLLLTAVIGQFAAVLTWLQLFAEAC